MFAISVGIILFTSISFGLIVSRTENRKLKPLEFFAKMAPQLIDEIASSNVAFPDKLTNAISQGERQSRQLPPREETKGAFLHPDLQASYDSQIDFPPENSQDRMLESGIDGEIQRQNQLV